jgi:D-glycero-beta-D-manno-heptose-7-phosphate kinase
MQNIEVIFEQFAKLNVLIVGDVMIDRYIHGKVNRISPEAPVPVVEFTRSEERLGGAANVALNINALGATPYLFSVIGQDRDAGIFQNLLRNNNLPIQGITLSQKRMTTVKTRIVAGSQQLLRIDTEQTQDLDTEQGTDFLQNLEAFLAENTIDVLILQDYNKGVLSEKVIEGVLHIAQEKKIPTVVDPKKKNFLRYRNVTLFKPNLKEIREALPFDIKADVDSLQNAADYLRSKLGHQATMITLSEKGLFLQEKNAKGHIFPTKNRQIADVSGAGDTVISVAALGIATALDKNVLAHLCNIAGGQVCEEAGVVPVNLDKFKRECTMNLCMVYDEFMYDV